MQPRQDGNVGRYALGLMIVLLAAPLAGCIGDSGQSLDAASSEEEGTLEETTVPFEEQASFDVGAGVCTMAGEITVTNACNGARIVLEETPPGTVQEANLELTWTPESPLMEELGMTLAWGCQDRHSDCRIEWTAGTSPLELDVDEIDDEGELILFVWTRDKGTEQAYLDTSAPQDVEISGTFTSLVPGGSTGQGGS